MVENKQLYVIAYRTQSELYELDQNQFVLQQTFPFAIKAVFAQADDLLLCSEQAVVSYTTSAVLLSFPTPIQHVRQGKNCFFVVSRNELCVYAADWTLITSHLFTFDLAALAIHEEQGLLSLTFLLVDQLIVAVSEWVSNTLYMLTFAQQQLAVTTTETYPMTIKSIIFAPIQNESTSILYCLLNHIDGGIRILKHVEDQWLEDKYVLPCTISE